MVTLIDGLNLRLSDILSGHNHDVHGHEITFEKTGSLEYSSVYFINCNRKYVIDLSSVIVTVKEIVVPDDDVLYSDIPDPKKMEEQTPTIQAASKSH
jgi:hypothetical protein